MKPRQIIIRNGKAIARPPKRKRKDIHRIRLLLKQFEKENGHHFYRRSIRHFKMQLIPAGGLKVVKHGNKLFYYHRMNKLNKIRNDSYNMYD